MRVSRAEIPKTKYNINQKNIIYYIVHENLNKKIDRKKQRYAVKHKRGQYIVKLSPNILIRLELDYIYICMYLYKSGRN